MDSKDHQDDSSPQVPHQNSSADATVSSVVAKHYNDLREKGLEERKESRIFYLRNFNNWVKSMLIADYLRRVKEHNVKSRKKETMVLDLCCGKGGDLLKWRKGGIDYLVCADIAKASVEQCEHRYNEMRRRSSSEWRPQKMFEAEFIEADCTRVPLKDMYKRQDISYDIVSCQFSFHYCFESLAQAEQMLHNVSDCMRVGGFFIGTTPDSYEIVRRLKSASPEATSFGNDVYNVTYDNFSEGQQPPMFGAKYNFHLEGVVDCPEFLVYFPLLEELARKHNLKLLYKKRFDEFYKEYMDKDIRNDRGYSERGRQLLGHMQALETYPPFEDTELLGKAEDYDVAKEAVKQIKESERTPRVGTLSRAEWEVACMYIVFAFEKVESRKRGLEDESDDELNLKK